MLSATLGRSVLPELVRTIHFAAGAALVVARRMEVFAEGVPLGEQAIAAGTSLVF